MSEIDYRAIRRRVILRWLNRMLFLGNVLLWLFVASLLDRYPVDTASANSLFVVWFLILIAHFLWAFNIVGSFIQRQTEREAERLRARGYTVNAPMRDTALIGAEKPKRAARLSDDGEIEYDDGPRELDEVNAARRQHTQD